MNAYIALEKYIVKEEKNCGVGVPVTPDEDVAKYESSRRKGVQSYNNWILIDIPDPALFLDVRRPLKEQSREVLNALSDRDFLMTLFVHEARKLFDGMDSLVAGKDAKKESEKIFTAFSEEKYESLLKFPTGLDFFNFIVSKCITRDRAKSSALLYNFGIKGCSYTDGTGERFLMFNAKKDIDPLEYRSVCLQDSRINA